MYIIRELEANYIAILVFLEVGCLKTNLGVNFFALGNQKIATLPSFQDTKHLFENRTAGANWVLADFFLFFTNHVVEAVK